MSTFKEYLEASSKASFSANDILRAYKSSGGHKLITKHKITKEGTSVIFYTPFLQNGAFPTNNSQGPTSGTNRGCLIMEKDLRTKMIMLSP